MDKLFSEDFQSAFANRNHPAVNITEREKEYAIAVMAPGLSKSDFNISLDENLLTISYEKKEEKAEETEKFIRREFAMQSFKRSFTVSDQINVDEITADYENGLLTVHIPKTEEKAKEEKVKTIQVN